MIENGRRNFLKVLGAAGTMALVCRDSVVSAASRAKNTLLAASKLQVQGIGLEPSSIERVEAPQIDVKVHADNFQIQEVRGNGLIDSRLTNGRLAIEINPIFDWDFGVDLLEAKEDPAERFRKLGLTDEQARKVVNLIEKDFFKEEKPFEEPRAKVSNVRTGEGKDETVVAEERVAAGVEIPLPSFRIPRIQPSINLNNLIINDINLQSATSLESNNIDISGLRLNDFEVAMSEPEFVLLDKAEITNFRMRPMNVPSFGLNNLKTEVVIPKLGSSEIPISIESRNGISDVRIPLINWRKTWEINLGFRVLWKRVRLRIEFGFELKLTLKYRWVIELLQVNIRFINAFLNNILIAISVPSLIFTNLKIGLLKIAKLLYSKV